LVRALSWHVSRVELSGSLLDSVRLPTGEWGVIALAVCTVAVIASVEIPLSA
jgi:hypothetical protein